MSNKILITWTNSWIWNYLATNLVNENKIIWVWRWENNIIWIDYIKWDLKDIKTIESISNFSDSYDYVVINAGIWYFDKFENISIEKHKETIETNLTSPILLLQLLLQEKKIKKWIIFMGSIAGKKSMSRWSSYAASKFWLRWFAMQLKNELKWIKVHIINPSIVEKNYEWKITNYELVNISSKNNWITLKNNFEYFWNYKKTTLDDILEVVNNLINWNENRFEIDL